MDKIIELVVGKTKEEGYKLCEENGYHMVVVREDDERFFISADLNFYRVRSTVVNNIITNASIG